MEIHWEISTKETQREGGGGERKRQEMEGITSSGNKLEANSGELPRWRIGCLWNISSLLSSRQLNAVGAGKSKPIRFL